MKIAELPETDTGHLFTLNYFPTFAPQWFPHAWLHEE